LSLTLLKAKRKNKSLSKRLVVHHHHHYHLTTQKEAQKMEMEALFGISAFFVMFGMWVVVPHFIKGQSKE